MTISREAVGGLWNWKQRFAARAMVCAVAVLAGAHTAMAQSAPMVYPSQGQSMQQQANDEAECRGWAQQQTGFNPAQGPAYAGAAPGPNGQVVRGAAGGAALGAIGGAIGGNAGKGAAIGAGVGATAGLLRRGQQNRAQADAQQRSIDQYNRQLADYNRGFATCMQGRGYAVN